MSVNIMSIIEPISIGLSVLVIIPIVITIYKQSQSRRKEMRLKNLEEELVFLKNFHNNFESNNFKQSISSYDIGFNYKKIKLSYLFLGHSIVLELITSMLKTMRNNNQSKEEKVLILFLLKSKALKFEKVLTILILSLVFNILFSYSFSKDYLLVGISSLIIISYYIYIKVLEYRVKSGFFGGNQYEAREIVSYFLNNKDDFTHHDGEKILFSEKKIEKILDFSTEEEKRGFLQWV